MNLLEHHIKEIYDVKVVNMDGGWSYVLVDMMIDCYGQQQRVLTSFPNIEEWEKVKEQGYYLA